MTDTEYKLFLLGAFLIPFGMALLTIPTLKLFTFINVLKNIIYTFISISSFLIIFVTIYGNDFSWGMAIICMASTAGFTVKLVSPLHKRK